MPKRMPGFIHLQIVEVMKRFPEGITAGQIRLELEREGLPSDKQTHLDRRKRDLKKWFVIEKIRARRLDPDGKSRWVLLYVFRGDRTEISNSGEVSGGLRARILHAAHGRCQMCGRTIKMHGIVLVVDHKKPQDWGGTNDPENLWAICEQCNGGKQAYFSSIDVSAELIKTVMANKSVHVRIGEALKAFGVGGAVPGYLLELVADQEDWQKRLRELRYPVIGWHCDHQRRKVHGRVHVDYILRKFRPWPDDPTGAIRSFEKQRKARNSLRGAPADEG